jgi:hypothetical protein
MCRMYLVFVFVFLMVFHGSSQCNNVNLADGRPWSACFASETANLLDPWRAFDVGSGSDQTRWGASSGADTAYFGIDLAQAYSICSIAFTFGSFDYPVNFKVQGSNNMSSWTDLRVVTGNTQSVLTLDNLSTSGTYRYVRVYMTQRAYNWAYYNIYQCQIYNRVVNTPPTVSLTAPSAGASYIQGTTINITSDAADVDGTVSSVQFYNGATLLGADSSAPFSFNWANAAVGAYDIYAKAIDNGGGSTWTDPIHITVTTPPASMRNWNLTGNNLLNSNTGYVAIGGLPTNTPSDTAIKLSVKGTIFAKKLTVTQSLWPDYVFTPDYKLLTLQQLETFIQKNKHLPGITAAKQVEKNGLNVGDNQAALLQKIEELTLYIIDMNKKLEQQQKQIQALQQK